ncbi:MAG: putative secreted protein [Herbinix sp.]|jgi:LPXTG-motif cell wall-anchored protein|nr:putative secreted protein [Herbinix sp.]
MIKSKLMKALMLGLCMSALTTGAAFAQANVGSGSAPSSGSEVQSDELDALYAKQKDIDQYLFEDHAKEIEDMGFMVNYTGVVGDVIEIGISPFSDENADYLYGAFGKDSIKVVEFDQSVIYASGVADAGTDDAVVDGDTVKDDMQETLEDAGTLDATGDGKVYKGSDDEVNIQIESTDETAEVDPELIYQTTAADIEGENVKTVSAAEDTDAVKRGGEEDATGVSAPMMILAIAGGAALIGGAVVVSSKKKTTK